MDRSIAVSIGEPAGIGPDVILGAWAKRGRLNLPHFSVVGDIKMLEERCKKLGLDVPLRAVSDGAQAFNCNKALPVIATRKRMSGAAGIAVPANSTAVIEAIERSVELVLNGEFCALTTCPINKKALYDSGFDFPGHTEFLANLAEKLTGKTFVPVMMLAGPKLRCVPVTIHIPLQEVKNRLTMQLIVETARITC